MAVVVQGLVAIGGRGRRLAGVDVGVSKAFLPGLNDKPFLYWCLRSLEEAGIRRVLLAAHTPFQEQHAWDVVGEGVWTFDKVDVFVDAGRGVHGIPHQARHLLDENVLFEAGHNVCAPDHYRELAERKKNDNVVFSAFVPQIDNPRFRTHLGGGGRCRENGTGDPWALAHPMVIDRAYVARLPEHDFTVDRIAAAYRSERRLFAVPAVSPVEFDVDREHRRTLNVHASNARDCAHGLPWRGKPQAGAAEITLERR